MDEHPSAVAPMASPMGQLYTIEEVARFLRVTQRAVQVWIKRGELPAVRYGRLLRVRQADLVAFGEVLNQRTPPPLSPRTSAPRPLRLARRRSEPPRYRTAPSGRP